MKKWPYAMGTYNHDLVRKFCVEDEEWQSMRLSMKGVPTESKLDMLEKWREMQIGLNGDMLSHRHQVQIDNYINALKRGGQLNMQLEVVR